MRRGYARVSTEDQKLDLQIQALERAGCTEIYTDYGISGADFARPGLKEILSQLQKGDTLVVWRLDRLGRSLVQLVQFMEKLSLRGIEFHSLMENIDTGSSGGRLVFHMIAALSEFERALISERTRAGMAAAKRKGRVFGRPLSLSRENLENAITAVRLLGEPLADVAQRYQLSIRTLSRMIKRAETDLSAAAATDNGDA